MIGMTWKQEQTKQLLKNKGIDFGDVLYVVEVGSTAHGISAETTDDDHDYTVLRIEDFEELITGDPRHQSMMARTQPEGHRSRMGDIDLQIYTIRKFATLASRGNPSILTALFSPKVHHHQLWILDGLEQLEKIIPSKAAGNAFLGYMRQQMERWIGVRGQKNVKRPELVEAYGFDTKYAAHVIRLGHQGIEYMEKGRFTLPLEENLADAIVGLRTGAMEEYDAMAWAKNTEDRLKVAIDNSDLPEHPNTRGTKKWIEEQYRIAVMVP
jgi:predicted nucleotidyltransferase